MKITGQYYLLQAGDTDIRELKMEKSSTDKDQPKKSYVKPRLRQVDLRPEEAVLGACKTGSTAGPASSPCNAIAVGCSTAGS